MAFGLEKFKKSPIGRHIGSILEDPQSVSDMIVFSRHEMPAVQAIGKDLLPLGPDLCSDQVKKSVGRWVREILEQHGWTVWKKRRVTPGNLFSTGMVYRPKAPLASKPSAADTAMSPAERAAAWREAAKNLPRTTPLSEEAISRDNIYSGCE